MIAASTDPERLAGLADRCEAASGPDRILDYEIRAAIRGAPVHGRIVKVTREGWETVHYEGGGVSQGSEPRAYSASLDAAMSLVPDGLWRRINVDPNGRANIRLGDACAVTAATPALALCAAALRALAHQEQSA